MYDLERLMQKVQAEEKPDMTLDAAQATGWRALGGQAKACVNDTLTESCQGRRA